MIHPIKIKVIPHDKQRYETTGDWIVNQKEELVKISVSDMDNSDYEFLVALHELIEAWLCIKKGISEKLIFDYDTEYENARNEKRPAPCGCLPTEDNEPGDDPHAPYYLQHKMATILEKQMANFLEVNWDEYNNYIISIGEENENKN